MRTSYLHLASAALLFLVVVAGYAYFDNKLGTMQNDVATERAEAATADATVAELTANSSELAALSSKEAAVEGYFVSNGDVVSFLENLQQLGQSLGSSVTVDSVSEATDVHQHLNLQLHVDGSFDAVMRTVGAIEYAPYDITVNALTLGTDSGAGGWSAAVSLWVGTASSSPAVSEKPLAPQPAATTTATSSAATASSTAADNADASTTP